MKKREKRWKEGKQQDNGSLYGSENGGKEQKAVRNDEKEQKVGVQREIKGCIKSIVCMLQHTH